MFNFRKVHQNKENKRNIVDEKATTCYVASSLLEAKNGSLLVLEAIPFLNRLNETFQV